MKKIHKLFWLYPFITNLNATIVKVSKKGKVTIFNEDDDRQPTVKTRVVGEIIPCKGSTFSIMKPDREFVGEEVFAEYCRDMAIRGDQAIILYLHEIDKVIIVPTFAKIK